MICTIRNLHLQQYLSLYRLSLRKVENKLLLNYCNSQNCISQNYSAIFSRNKKELVQEFKVEPLGRILPDRIDNDGDYNRNNKFLRYDLPREWYSKNITPSVRRSRTISYISECAKVRGCTPMLVSRMVNGPLRPSELKHFSPKELSRLVMALGIMKQTNCLHGDKFRIKNALLVLVHESKTWPRLLTYDTMALAQVATGISMFDLGDAKILNELVEESLKPHRLRNFSSESIANMLQAMGKVGYENSLHVKVLSDIVKKNLGDMPGFSLGKIMQAWITLKYKDTEAIELLLEESSTGRRLSQFVASNVCDILVASARFNLHETKSIKIIVREFIHSQKWQFMDDKTLASIIWALGHLKHDEEQDWQILISSVTQKSRLENLDLDYLLKVLLGWAKVSYRNGVYLEKLLGYVVRESRLAAHDGNQLNQILLCLFKLGKTDAMYTGPMRRELAIRQKINSLSMTTKMNSLLRSDAMEIYREELIGLLLSDIVKSENLKNIDTLQLIAFCSAIEIFGKNYIGYYDIVLREITSSPNRLSSLTNSNLFKIFSSWTKIGYRDKAIINTFGKSIVSTPEKLAVHDDKELVVFCWTLSHLGCTDLDVFGKLTTQIVEREPSVFTGKGISMIISGWAKVKYINRDALKLLIEEVKKEQKLKSLKRSYLRSLIWALQILMPDAEEDIEFFKEELNSNIYET